MWFWYAQPPIQKWLAFKKKIMKCFNMLRLQPSSSAQTTSLTKNNQLCSSGLSKSSSKKRTATTFADDALVHESCELGASGNNVRENQGKATAKIKKVNTEKPKKGKK